MFQSLGRCVAFVIGVMLIADIAMPTRVEQLQVDRHTSASKRTADTDYTLHLVGGAVSSCSVGHATYNRLNDGDRVEVQSTKVFRHCIRLAQGDDVIEKYHHWQLFVGACGLLLIAVAVGWVRSGDDDDDAVGIGFRIR